MALNETQLVAADSPSAGISFLDLPAEIRSEIYRHRCAILTATGDLEPMTWQQFYLRLAMFKPLFDAHDQIRKEAVPIFLSSNILHLTGTRRRYYIDGNFAPRSTSQTTPLPTILNYMTRQYCYYQYQHTIEVPPSLIRHFFKNVEISLQVPDPNGEDDEGEIHAISKAQMVRDNREIDWLEFIRAMPKLGFTKFERLAIEVSHREFETQEIETEFKEWTRKQIDGMVDTKELIVTFRQMKKYCYEFTGRFYLNDVT